VVGVVVIAVIAVAVAVVVVVVVVVVMCELHKTFLQKNLAKILGPAVHCRWHR